MTTTTDLAQAIITALDEAGITIEPHPYTDPTRTPVGAVTTMLDQGMTPVSVALTLWTTVLPIDTDLTTVVNITADTIRKAA